MSFRFPRPLAAGLTALAAASVLGCAGENTPESQVPPADPGLPATSPAPFPGSGDDLRSEYAAVQQRLNGLQQQAMQDTVIQKQYAELEAMVETQMKAADPELEQRRTRLMELQGEMGAAQQAGEDDKLQALLEEGTAIQGLLRQTQQETMALEEVEAKMTAFREAILARMAEIDPEAPKLVDRANELGEQLTAAAAAAGPPAPGGAPSTGSAPPETSGE